MKWNIIKVEEKKINEIEGLKNIDNSKKTWNNMQNIWGSAEVKTFNPYTVLLVSFWIMCSYKKSNSHR